MAASNVRYFTFIDRFVQIKFFEDDPVIVTVMINDENDAKMEGVAKSLASADTLSKKTDILYNLIGEENTDKLIERADEPDNFALTQLILYINRTYFETRQKNLNTAASGHTR